MHDSVHFTDICQELVAQAFTLGRTLYKACNINKFYSSMSNLFCMVHLAKLLDTLIRYRYYTDIRIDGTERKVRSLRSRLGQ